MSIKVGTCGTFDYILHLGHIKFLEFAASQGNELIVFVVADETIKRNKNREPFYNQDIRCKNIEHLGYKTIRLTKSANESLETIVNYGVDVYIFGADQNTLFDIELENRFEFAGVKVLRYRYKQKIYSTTKLLIEAGLLNV